MCDNPNGDCTQASALKNNGTSRYIFIVGSIRSEGSLYCGVKTERPAMNERLGAGCCDR